MKALRLYILSLLAFYNFALGYILIVVWLSGGISEAIKDGLVYGVIGGVFGLLAERTYQRIREKRKHGN